MSLRTVPFRIVEISAKTVTIGEYGESSSVLIDRVTMAPTTVLAQDVMNYGMNGNKDGLTTSEIKRKVRTTHAQLQNVE